MTDPTPFDSLDDYRFAAYLSDAMSPDERAAFDARLAADPDAAARFHVARAAWLAGARPPVPVDVPAAWARVRAVLGVDARPAASPAPPPHPRPPRLSSARRSRPWLGIAAAGAALLALVVGGRAYRNAPAAAAHTYHTGPAQRATVVLADGSRVTLAPRTTLSVDGDFGRAARGVTVRGEAYFDVASSVGTPFLVRTGAVTTRVLGTSFDVKRYDDDAHVRVVVRTGKVVVQSARASLLLTAGMLGRVTDSGGVATRVGDAEAYAGWTTGGLRFANVPVPEMLRQLGQWYGITFTLSDSTLSHRDVTITYDRVSAEQAISMLENLLGVRASYAATPNGARVVTLTPAPRAAARKKHGGSTFTPSHEVGK